MFVAPTKTLTLNKLQFLGIITNEYRDHMIPVAAKAEHCDMLNFSAGRVISPIPAMTKPWKNLELQLNERLKKKTTNQSYPFKSGRPEENGFRTCESKIVMTMFSIKIIFRSWLLLISW